jgi:hypothetical protein
MSFDTEQEAFEQYAAAMPGNLTFLVDTYDTLEGVSNAVRIGNRFRETGLAALDPTIRRLANPHSYPAGLAAGLHQEKINLIQKARPK